MSAKGTAIKNTARMFRKHGCPVIAIKPDQEFAHVHPSRKRYEPGGDLYEPPMLSNGPEGEVLRRVLR